MVELRLTECRVCGGPLGPPSHSTDPKQFCSISCGSKYKRAEYARRRRAGPEPPAVPSARWIPLGDGVFVLVDADLFEALNEHFWSYGCGYARRQTDRATGKLLRLHHVVMGRKIRTDHINGNRLDCRRQNLRPATQAQNCMNRRASGNTSRYKGVCRHPSGGWLMQITKNGRRTTRYFLDELEAAYAYDDAARTLFGEFARLNFPRPGEQPAVRGEVPLTD